MKQARYKRREGSHFQRSDGRYVVKSKVKSLTGKSEHKQIGLSKAAVNRIEKAAEQGEAAAKRVFKEEADKVHHEVRRQQEARIDIENADQEFGQYLRHYLKYRIEEDFTRPIKPKTAHLWEYAIEKHLIPHLGHLRLNAVTNGQIQDLLNRLLRQGLAVSTVGVIRKVATLALRQGQRWHLLTTNEAALTVMPPMRRKRHGQVLSVAEAQALIEVSAGTVHGNIITVMLFHAMRIFPIGLQGRYLYCGAFLRSRRERAP